MGLDKDCLEHFAKASRDSLPSVRYNKKMLGFLCKQMTQVACLFPDDLENASQNVVSILKYALKGASALVRDHARIFNLRTFYKVEKVSRKVEEFCITFSECFIDLGIDPTTNIKTKLDPGHIREDKRFMDWYLACVLEDHSASGGHQNDRDSELMALIAEHKRRMEIVRLIKETEIQLTGKIGDGGFGEIFRGIWRGVDVAIKKIRRDLTLEARAEFYTEVELQTRMDHRNVVQCHGATDAYAMVMELALTDLEKLLRQENDMTWTEKLHIMLSAAEGVRYVHESGVIHRDIKPQNFLVFQSLNPTQCLVKVGDFGLATVKTETRSMTNRPLEGTTLWIAPEIYNGEPHHLRTDVFSFGLVLFEIASLSGPYKGLSSDAQVLRRKKNMTDPCVLPDDCPHELADLMRSCIMPECERRPTMVGVCSQLQKMLRKVRTTDMYVVVLAIAESTLVQQASL